MQESTLEREQDEASEFVWGRAEARIRGVGHELEYAYSTLTDRISDIYQVKGEDLNSYQRRLLDQGIYPLQNIFESLGKILLNYDLDAISHCNKHTDTLNQVDNELTSFLEQLEHFEEVKRNGN